MCVFKSFCLFLIFPFFKVAQLKGRVKELEQELLDLKDGSDEENILPVGKLQVSTFLHVRNYERETVQTDKQISFTRV